MIIESSSSCQCEAIDSEEARENEGVSVKVTVNGGRRVHVQETDQREHDGVLF